MERCCECTHPCRTVALPIWTLRWSLRPAQVPAELLHREPLFLYAPAPPPQPCPLSKPRLLYLYSCLGSGLPSPSRAIAVGALKCRPYS